MLQNRLFNRGSDISRLIAGMLPLPVWQSMMTARGDNGNIAEEQLTYIIEQVYERSVPDHPLLNFINFDTSAPAGAQATKYYQGEARARFKPMGPQSSDFDVADLGKKAIVCPVESYFSGYEVWLREAEALAMSGGQAVPRMARAVLMAYRDLLVLHTLVGDADAGIDGLLTTDKITNSRRYSDSNRLSATSTADQIFDLLADLAFSIADTSEDIFGDEGGYVLAVPSQLFRKASRTFFGNDANISAKDRFELTTGFSLVGLNRLNAIDGGLLQDTTGNKSCAIAGKFTPETHAKQLPKPLEQLTPHIDHAGLRTCVPSVTNIGGVHLYEPLSFATARNIWETT
jgi:hypothetical protein